MSRLVYFLIGWIGFYSPPSSTVAAQTGDPNMAPPTSASGMAPPPPMGASWNASGSSW